jgi:hypothetical protein
LLQSHQRQKCTSHWRDLYRLQKITLDKCLYGFSTNFATPLTNLGQK